MHVNNIIIIMIESLFGIKQSCILALLGSGGPWVTLLLRLHPLHWGTRHDVLNGCIFSAEKHFINLPVVGASVVVNSHQWPH